MRGGSDVVLIQSTNDLVWSHTERMLFSGIDPESYITEHFLV